MKALLDPKLETKRLAEHSLAHVFLGTVTAALYQRNDAVAIVLRYGDLKIDGPVPVRVQSACRYGEVLGAADCDCRPQLEQSFKEFKAAGRGVLIYLDQEGRGAGLITKALAYELQDRDGLDTAEAYDQLKTPYDQRSYKIAEEILRDLQVGHIQLLTNNPRKQKQLDCGTIKVDREPLLTDVTPENRAYLETKRDKLGHLLTLGARLPL